MALLWVYSKVVFRPDERRAYRPFYRQRGLMSLQKVSQKRGFAEQMVPTRREEKQYGTPVSERLSTQGS